MKKGLKRFTLIEIMIVVAIIAILGAIAIPSLSANRDTANKKKQEHFVQVVTMAKERWAMDYGKGDNDTPTFSDLKPYMPLINKKSDLEVEGKAITINAVGTDPCYGN